jgi:isopenicillin-N epimerase
LTANDVVERIADAAGAKTRLAIIDHIASPTAVVFPVVEITRALKAKGARVLIDGAHGVGQLALDLPAIGADWYTANGHKWLYAPWQPSSMRPRRLRARQCAAFGQPLA